MDSSRCGKRERVDLSRLAKIRLDIVYRKNTVVNTLLGLHGEAKFPPASYRSTFLGTSAREMLLCARTGRKLQNAPISNLT